MDSSEAVFYRSVMEAYQDVDNNRVFDLNRILYGRSRTYRHASDVMTYDSTKGITKLTYQIAAQQGVLKIGKESLVIAIDRACSGNGTPSARVAYGCFFWFPTQQQRLPAR